LSLVDQMLAYIRPSHPAPPGSLCRKSDATTVSKLRKGKNWSSYPLGNPVELGVTLEENAAWRTRRPCAMVQGTTFAHTPIVFRTKFGDVPLELDRWAV